MKKIIVPFIAMFMFFMIGGCASSGALDSSAVADFQPQEQYAVNYDKAWDCVNKALFNEGIITTTAEKSAGRILTDYVDGGVQVDWQGSMSRRYKFFINIEKINENNTSIKIIGKLESMTKRITWHDISSSNKKQVAQKVNLIYQKIEAEINKSL